MSGGNKPYYDREDLDEDEKKLFDAMVAEEMEKLERQFENTSLENERNNQQPLSHQPHPDNGNDSRNHPSNFSQSSNNSNTDNHSQSSARRAPRISLVTENYNRSNHSQAQNNSIPLSSEHARQQVEASRPLNEAHEQQNFPRRSRRDESPPESRCVLHNIMTFR